MNSLAMMLGGQRRPAAGGIGGIDEACLALIRPVYSGGVWAPGDASLYKRTVTNTSLTIGAEGSGPWGGTSRSLMDGSAGAFSYTDGSYLSTARAFAIWAQCDFQSPGSASQIFAKISGSSNGDRLNVFLAVDALDATHIKISAVSYPTSGAAPQYVVSATILPGTWRHFYVDFSAGIKFYVDGALVGTQSFTPNIGTSPVWAIGRWAWSSTIYSASGEQYAEAAVWSSPPWTEDFDPPTGPYTKD